MPYVSPDERKNHRSAALVCGFGATAAMWTAGYFARLPAVNAPGEFLFGALVICLLGGGYVAGMTTGSARAGLYAGLVSSLLNLLILGSLLTSPAEANDLKPAAFLYVPGFFLMGAAAGWLGGRLGAGGGSGDAGAREWANWLAHITAIATLLLIGAGGLVTTKGAGLDVPDWPNSFGYNMFLYPLSRMTGGIYYEHAHRLFGTLVGLAMLSLSIFIQRNDDRRWLKAFAWTVFGLVCVQGVLGGIRVTEKSIDLAWIHGVLGQAIFALMVVIAAVSLREYHDGPAARPAPGYGTEKLLGWLLVIFFPLQVALGALLRHREALLHAHITFAVVVILIAGFAGFRAWGLYPDIRPLKKVGLVLLILAGIQLALGFAALIFRGLEADHRTRSAAATLLITLHQAVGALLLATVALHFVWVRRRLVGEEATVPRAAVAVLLVALLLLPGCAATDDGEAAYGWERGRVTATVDAPIGEVVIATKAAFAEQAIELREQGEGPVDAVVTGNREPDRIKVSIRQRDPGCEVRILVGIHGNETASAALLEAIRANLPRNTAPRGYRGW